MKKLQSNPLEKLHKLLQQISGGLFKRNFSFTEIKYVVDFYCRELQIVIEINTNSQIQKDVKKYLLQHNIQFLLVEPAEITNKKFKNKLTHAIQSRDFRGFLPPKTRVYIPNYLKKPRAHTHDARV